MSTIITGKTTDPKTGLTTYDFGNSEQKSYPQTKTVYNTPGYNPYQTVPVPSPNNAGTIVDTSNSPAVDTSKFKSDANTLNLSTQKQISDISAQIAKIQEQANKLQPQGTSKTGLSPVSGSTTGAQVDAQGNSYDAQGNPIKEQPTEQSNWDKLMGIFNQGKEKISNLPALPTVEEATNKYLAGLGITPEAMKQVGDLNNQLTVANKQIQDLENQKNVEIGNLSNNPELTGSDITSLTNKINRTYAIKEANSVASSSLLTTQINMLTGNYEKANAAAQNYVQAATAAQRQTVQDIEYTMDFYKDVYSAMDASDQKQLQMALSAAQTQLKFQETQSQNDINNQLKQQGLDIQKMLAENKLATTGENATSPGQIIVSATGAPVKLTDVQSTTFQRYDQYINDLLPTAKQLLDPNSPTKVGTGGAIGTIIQRLQNVPIAQRTLTEGQNQLQSVIATMNNQLIYMLSGKQINEQEYERLKKQLPDLTLTNEQNMTRINLFDKLMNQARNTYLKLNGWTIKGENTSTQSGGGTTIMTAPDGQKWNVPNEQINTFKQNGYK
jgi:hypothetical protein